MYENLSLSDALREALHALQPVVALESTLITHGLPYPANVEIAQAMQQTIREAGAIPATIAVLEGQIKVGLSDDEIERLGQAEPGSVRKVSRRDLPLVMGLGLDGATTVATTMLIAHWAGIHIFATGGIGGVHRGQPFDISADLRELSQTPVMVVCAGAKAILDLPLTLEVLETYGVPVVGYGTDTLPAFYARSSGLPLDVRVDTPQEAVQIMRAVWALRLNTGVLLAAPIPEADALEAVEIETVIAQATEDALQQNIHGKDLTPFLLARIANLTGERSVQANRALLLNNARVAADVAVEWHRATYHFDA